MVLVMDTFVHLVPMGVTAVTLVECPVYLEEVVAPQDVIPCPS